MKTNGFTDKKNWLGLEDRKAPYVEISLANKGRRAVIQQAEIAFWLRQAKRCQKLTSKVWEIRQAPCTLRSTHIPHNPGSWKAYIPAQGCTHSKKKKRKKNTREVPN